MSEKQAFELYEKVTGRAVGEPKYNHLARWVAADLQNISESVERMGGTLQSRQMIAAIIHFSEFNFRNSH